MDTKVRIFLGILLVFITTRQIQCASLHHIRTVRDVTTPSSSKIEQITNSSLSSSQTKDLVTENSSIDNKIKFKVNDALSIENEHSKIQATTSDPIGKPNVSRGNKKYEQSKEDSSRSTEESSKSLKIAEDESKKLEETRRLKSTEEESSRSPKSAEDESKRLEETRISTSTEDESKKLEETRISQSTEEEIRRQKEEETTTSKSGRSLNIDIDKYISPEFHNKNNVYSMPTSPEIEKYLDPESHDYTEVTNGPRKSSEIQTDFNSMELTTPQSNLFDPKFRMAVDRIKQNLDEINTNTEQFKEEENRFEKEDDDEKYEVSKLIDNYKNADNDTEITLHTNEYKNIDLKTDKNKHNKDMESGKNVDYESKQLKSQTYGDKPEYNNISATEKTEVTEKNLKAADTQIKSQIVPSSTTILPTKKSRTQTSLRNNTIETTAPDSDIKPKSLKHFGDTTNIDPLREIEKATYTKPTYENAINISKRGSTKFSSTTPTTIGSFMDYDNKNFSIPPTATAWTLVSLKDVPSLKENQTITEAEQNSRENHLVNVPLTTPGKTEVPTTEKIQETTKNLGNNIDYSTTTDSTDPTAPDNTESESSKLFKKTTMMVTELPSTTEDQTEDFTSVEFDDESITSTTREETTQTDDTTTFRDASTIKLDDLDKSEETTTFNFKTTTTQTTDETTIYSTTEIPTTMENYFETQSDVTTTEITPTEFSEVTTVIPTDKMSTKVNPSTTTTTKTETTNYVRGTTKFSTTASIIEDEDLDSGGEDTDYPEVTLKKNITDTHDPEIENVDMQSTQTSTTSTTVFQPTTPSTIRKDQKSVRVENVTVDATSSTESLSIGNEPTDDNNTGMIAAITISSIGGVCLILLAGLLLIMRKRQKRVTYGQRCRPVSLDAYSLDNVSVYNSVRRKGALRASKRSYGNPAFDDPVSTSHQMNFQQLAKFVDNAEAMSAEFEEIPQVTARANEVPDGCETKNRYANVIPLPETRVFLKPFDNDPQSDYINANYVTGPKNIRGYYIATQGPMNSTVDDFWRMIWEQQCRVILMLTNLYENGIEKCADYLPPSEVLDCHRLFGDFQITLKKREVKEKYIISSLQLKNMVSNSWREVTHLWYIGWPERGVPTEANSLIAFLIEARSHLKAASNNNSSVNDYKSRDIPGNMHMSGSSRSSSDSGPLVVHCSPGTGRTGTVISCDIAIRDFELTRNVDIPKIVYKVRRDRASAVQTKEQYSFIYKLISLYATKLTGGALESI